MSIIAHDAALQSHTGYTLVSPVTIGSGVYIGARAIVLPGSVIGDGAIIGAGSVVRGAIESGQIYAGSPAAPLGDPGKSAERLMSRDLPRMEVRRDAMANEDLNHARAMIREHGGLLIR